MKIGKERSAFRLKHLEDNSVICSPAVKEVFQMNSEIPFGKYKGTKTRFIDAFDKDPFYIRFLFEDTKDKTFFISASEEMRNKAAEVCAQTGVKMHPFYMLKRDVKTASAVDTISIQSFKLTLEGL